MHQYLSREVDRRMDTKSSPKESLNLNTEQRQLLCTHCQRKTSGLYRVCGHKWSQKKPQRPSSAKLSPERIETVLNEAITDDMITEDLRTTAIPQRYEESSVHRSKLRSRLEEARDEHFLSDDL